MKKQFDKRIGRAIVQYEYKKQSSVTNAQWHSKIHSGVR